MTRLSDLVRSGEEPAGRRTSTPAQAVAPPVERMPASAGGPAPEPSDPADAALQQAVERIRHSLAVRSEAPFSIGQAEQAIEILLQSLEASDALLMAFFRSPDADTNPARKAVNVAILSLKMGLELGYARPQLRQLGLAGLLCDVGTALMPARGLEGPDEEYAAIVHLADTYRGLVHPRPPRRRIGPLDALKEILQRHREIFPDRVLKALIRAMSTFPVGSLVRLNTDEVARVVERNKDYPLRPVVEVLVRRGRRLAQPARLDLAQRPLLYIKESLVEEDLS